jgi:hypothetical protein
MPRSKIPADMVHRIEDVQSDARLLDSLSRTVATQSLQIVSSALKRETSSTAADASIEIARSVLDQILAEGVIDSLTVQKLKTGLAEQLSSQSLEPDLELVEYISIEVGRCLVSGWVEILRQNLSRSERLSLTELLLPTRDESGSWHSLMRSVSSTPLTEIEIREILFASRDSLFREASTVQLPLGIIVLRERPGVYYALGSREFWDQKGHL